MLHRIFGRSGSGKTEYMISCLKDAQSMGMDCLFLVPEQQSMDTELLLERRGAADLNTEVLNFERLPNRVFREIGGVYSNTVDSVGKCVLVAAAVSNLGERLRLFSSISHGVLGELCATITALKRQSVSADMLSDIASRFEKAPNVEEGFISKLRETALIYGEYQRLLGDTLRDDDDDLTRLVYTEGAEDFFRGKAVFIDGIYTYTPQQYAVIRLIANSAAELYVSFTADEDESGLFDETMASAEKIKALYKGKTEDRHFADNYRIKNKALLYGESVGFSGGVYDGETQGIDLVGCASRYEEALYAAGVIYSLRDKGLKFSDIAIALRNPSSYEGILDTVLAGYGIPMYFGAKDTAASKPLSAALLALLEMAEGRLQLSPLKKYLKTTFSVLDEEEADSLIRYGESWDIKGKSLINDKPWLMNPEGYKPSFSPEAEEKLRFINEAKTKLSFSVLPLIEELKRKDLTVGKAVRLIYNHLVECGAPEKLEKAAEALIASGDSDGGAKTAALWDTLIGILERLDTLLGESPVTAGELRLIMEAMLESADIGAIPSYTDAVDVGDARLMRAKDVKAMVILGVNEGEFPSLPVKSGVFFPKESAFLEKEGVSLLPDVDKAINEERFFFYNCASAPSHYLFVSHLTGGVNRRSPLVSALCKLYGFEDTRTFGEDERDYLFCRKGAVDLLPYLKNKALKGALKQRLLEDEETAALFKDTPPLQDRTAVIDSKDISLMFISYSRVDCYNNCGFAYLMKYVLKLKDDRRLSFSSMDSGTYLHYLVESYVKKRMETGEYAPADRAEIEAELTACTQAYIKQIMPTPPTKRLQKLFSRLQNAAVFVCEDMDKEFGESKFLPQGFEVKIGTAEGSEVYPPTLISGGGIDVKISGSIDRLDTAEINGKKYVRVVDYKSSSHSVSVEGLKHGEGLQMFSYLFAYCDNDKDAPLPAGVLYREIGLPKEGKAPSQKGLINADSEVVRAMGQRFSRTRSKLSTEEFGELKEVVYSHVTETADLIAEGKMPVSCFKKREMDCDYCPYGEVCRLALPPKNFS